jgi:phosphoglycolate phosphatase
MTNPTILFDLDGTIADSRPGIIASLRAGLHDLGHTPAPDEDFTWAVGPPLPEVWGRLMAQFGDTRVELGMARYREHYGLTGLYDATLFPGIAEAIEALYRAGHELIVATAKRVDFARRLVENLGLAPRFLGVYGSVQDGSLDDKADLIADIMRREQLTADATVMIGDRRHDIHAAHANGVKAIGVAWGYAATGELQAAGADAIIGAPQELVTMYIP